MPEHARLIAKPHVILKSDQVIAIGALILLPQLHHRIRPSAGSRIGQARRFIGPKRSVSRPRRAISSIGRQASKNGVLSSAICGS